MNRQAHRSAVTALHRSCGRWSRRLAAVASTAVTLLALGAGASCLSGCGRGFVIVTPSGFAELEDQEDYGYRATNAEGVVIAVRREENSPFGDLEFWTGAVDAQLRRDGYVADKAVDVTSANGIDGRQIRYHRTREAREFVFWVSVFVTDGEVVVVEAGGDKEYFGKLEAGVGAAIDSLRVG